MITALIFQLYDFNLPCILHIDAFDFAIEVVLQEDFGRNLQLIAYELCKLRGAKYNYSIRDQEQLAIIHTTKI